jgi:hypothetical protein
MVRFPLEFVTSLGEFADPVLGSLYLRIEFPLPAFQPVTPTLALPEFTAALR